jgi:hypothetical protein
MALSVSGSRVVASLTTWFSTSFTSGFEVLSRASCVIARSSSAPTPGGTSLLASAHVTHPHRYPSYFPNASFLSALEDSSLRYSIELRDSQSGEILSRARLPPLLRPTRHPFRDVACMRLDANVEAILKTLDGLSVATLADTSPQASDSLLCEGHFLLAAKNSETNEDESLLLPRQVTGKLIGRSSAQAFLRTEEVLEMGMCGGPVTKEGVIVGIIEGIVPLDGATEPAVDAVQARARKLLGGAAVMVEVDALREVIDLSIK